jgi:hypothetical protein
MRKAFVLLLFLTGHLWLQAQAADTLLQRIVLIGDAGDLVGDTHPVVDWCKKNVDWNDPRNMVIFLGDNVYPLGLPMVGDPTYRRSKEIIDHQISLVKGTKGKAYFVPGNHDWMNGKIGGWQQVMNEVNYINSLELKNVEAWPRDGCPGPVVTDINDKIAIVFIDSQWFLHVHDKPGPESNCDAKTIDEFATELNEIVASHSNQLLLVTMHHPIYSYSVHGGDFSWKEHIFPLTAAIHWLYFPLPVLGSIYPIARGVFGNLQDLNHPLYRTMAKTIEEAVKKHPNPIVATGHDHCLQLIVKNDIPFIVSGSGANLNRVRKGTYTKFADADYGMSTIEVFKSGKVMIYYYNLLSTGLSNPTFTYTSKTIVANTTRPISDTLRPLPDSIVVEANTKLKGSAANRILLGENYRKEWTQPIKVQVLDIGKELGGVTPTKQGGGKQTKSLRVKDSTGKEWALRSIEKFPDAAIPADLRRTIAKDIVEEGVSASYPFASLSVGPLEAAAGVPHVRRKLLYIPDDPRLERFRSDFKNTLVTMEEREPIGVSKAYNTDELVIRLAKDHDDHVDQKEVLKARLVDNFIMDFDRHEGQWDWAKSDTGKGKLYYAIPKDRDQAFFVNEGILPWFVKKPYALPQLQGFRAHANNIKTFNWPARNFDRFFLNGLDQRDWKLAVDSFLNNMTDDVIQRALAQQPREIQQYHAQEIVEKLKERRKYFSKEMMQYYAFISRQVNIVGTNQKELFTITKNEDGTVRVVVDNLKTDGSIGARSYDRLFDPKVTKELRIFGLDNDDKFVVSGGHSPIRIRMIGGSGNDTFINNGSTGKMWVYDASFENNMVSGSGFTNKISNDPQVNRFDRIFYSYNKLIPGVSVEYNIDDGLFLGGRLQYIKQGFRKEPYSMRQFFKANHAVLTSSYHFQYNGEFIKALPYTDVVINGDFRAPINVTNFFGIGNNTVKDPNLGIDYYRTRYNIINASVLLRRQLQSWMRVHLGPTFQYFRVDSAQNRGKFVTDLAQSGLDPATAYKGKSYMGGEFLLDIDSRNNPVLPTRGAVLRADIRPLFGMNPNSHNITQLNADLTVYISVASESNLVYVTRFGYGHNIGSLEFPQAQYLGGTDNLRGFRKQRFAGRTMAFNNSEFRIKLGEFSTYLFPGSIGLQFFNDVGRVWADNESSNTWHDGFGGGVWISPIKRFVVTFSLAHSKEENLLPMVRFNFPFQ